MRNPQNVWLPWDSVHEATQLTAVHRAVFRQTIGENRQMVSQSVDLILSSKAAMRRVDVLLVWGHNI